MNLLRVISLRFITWLAALLSLSAETHAAVFLGNARLESNAVDSTSALTWNGTALTAACWFKISLPSEFTLTEDMAILVNNRTTNADNHAYAIYLNYLTGNIEFTSRGTGGLDSAKKLIEHPLLERWYHVAVVRKPSNLLEFYVDGRRVLSTTTTSGNSGTMDGISVGSWGNAKYFRGEIQEVTIYQDALTQAENFVNRLTDITGTSPKYSALRGYYKLPYSLNSADNYKNYASAPPAAGTASLVAAGTGMVEFPETDRNGEQSTFDLRKNNGRDAVGSLGGSFSWSHDAIHRACPGIPFDFGLEYNSSIGFNGQAFENGTDVYGEDNVLGRGWRHSYQMRLLAGGSYLESFPGSGVNYGLLDANGNLETWIRQNDGTFRNTHNEYRGELREVPLGGAFIEWTTPDRAVLRFHHPINSPAIAAGKVDQIRDFNGNTMSFAYDNSGKIASIRDAAGGIWTFSYTANLLTSVSGPSADAATKWTVTFNYTTVTVLGAPVTVLWKKTIAPPAGYPMPVISGTNLNPTGSTEWRFNYNGQGLLDGVVAPRFAGQNVYDIRVTYDTFGRKTQEYDANNRYTTFKYNIPTVRQLTTTEHFSGTSSNASDRIMVETFDRKLRLVTRKDPMGFSTSYEYDAAGNVTALIDPRGARTTMAYDARSNLTSRTNALGETTAWEYTHILFDGTPSNTPSNKPTMERRPATAEAPAGWENRYTYDPKGNLLTHTDGAPGGTFGTLATHEYEDPRGLVTLSKDANDHKTTFTYDATTGFLASRTIAVGTPQEATWTFTNNELGWMTSTTTPLTETTTLEYNVNGQVIATADAIGRVFRKYFDSNGNLVAESDGKGVNTTYEYDSADQRTAKRERPVPGSPATGYLWTFGYNSFGELTATNTPPSIPFRDSNGSTGTTTLSFTRAYDANGRLTAEIDPYSKSVAYEYDANGNQTAMVDKIDKRWEKTFDALNRVIAERDPEGNVRRTSFDAAGRVLVISSPNGFPTSHEYDGRGRLTKWKDAEGFAWIYAYDGVGNIRDIEDALNGHYVMTYGPRNERLTERNQDGKEWKYDYDALVRLATQTNPRGTGPGGGSVTRTLGYDPAGRLITVGFNTGRVNTLGYDDNNNVRSVTRSRSGQPTTTLLLYYDAMDRLVETRDTFAKSVTYSYDALSRVATKNYPGGKSLTHSYDKLSRLTALAFTGVAAPCTFAYDDAGRLTRRDYPNGVTQTNTFDNAGRIGSLGYAGSADPHIALTYAYDRNGNKTGGDETGVLKWEDANVTPYDETATFKPDGKLIARTDADSLREFTYAYDDAGNMTTATAGSESYAVTYDEDNRTASLKWDVGMASKEIENRYDALGRRVSRKLDGAETRYVLDLAGGMERILCDTNASGTITAWYVHGPDLCFKVTDTGALTCYHADAQGNIVRTTNASGATVNQYAYTPYGRAIDTDPSAITDTSDPYRFVGSQGVMLEFPAIASSNLYFMRARYYSGEAAAFFATDPVKNIGPGWKPEAYGYAGLSPMVFQDPDGLFFRSLVSKISSGIKKAATAVSNAFAKAVTSVLKGSSSSSKNQKQATNSESGGSHKVGSTSTSTPTTSKQTPSSNSNTSTVKTSGSSQSKSVITYDQKTGKTQLTNPSGKIVREATGYSGGNTKWVIGEPRKLNLDYRPDCINNEQCVGIDYTGPIPKGEYATFSPEPGSKKQFTSKGQNGAVKLTNQGLDDGYRIHWNFNMASGGASQGCIVFDLDTANFFTEYVDENPDTVLLVQ